jgi:DNA (cytosine-5)-methyltransferase 1
MWTYAEFFAGGGMARHGLGPEWRCVLANDNHPGKARSYVYNFGKDHFRYCDVGKLRPADVPGTIHCGWSSSPCQDVSLAGAHAGLSGRRSNAFWSWWQLIAGLSVANRAPLLLVLENVPGLLSSNGGADIAAISRAFGNQGYVHAIAKIDAKRFVAQSRPRVFVIGARQELNVDVASYVAKAIEALPARSNLSLMDVLETALPCHTAAETAYILRLMSPTHLAKIEEVRGAGKWVVGVYSKRTREEASVKIQRAEVRFDQIANALRTAGGGSSRQGLIAVNGAITRTRLLSPREAARLMGLADDYRLPLNANDAYDLIGDGVSPPVVRHLAAHVLEPILRRSEDAR